MVNTNPPNTRHLELAQALRQEGKLQMAAEYLMHWLQNNKNDSAAWALLAQCMFDVGSHDKAEIAYRRAIGNDPTRTDLTIPLATSLVAQGKNGVAIEVLQLALDSHPDNQDLALFLGMQLASIDRHLDALALFTGVVNSNPDNHVAWAFKSLAHTRLGEYAQAVGDAEKSIAINDQFAQAWFAKGRVLQKMGRWQEAADSLEQACKLNPNNQLALELFTSVSVTLVEQKGNSAEVTQLSQLNLIKAIQQDANQLLMKSADCEISYFKLKHDVEQAQYSLLLGSGSRAAQQLLKECSRLVLDSADNPAKKIRLHDKQADALAAYWLSLQVFSLDRMASSTLNASVDWRRIEEQYLQSTPEIVVIDNFLSTEALSAFQRFNLISPAWNREYPANKYLGAFSNSGFATPLHFQLAVDLRNAMPRVFKEHRLMEFWGFKYDAVIGRGINVHADHALVNLNFWVTPDEYNLDSHSGGLKIYDVPAPTDWSFGDYNSNSEKIYEFLSQHNAKAQTVTYRCNRAVLFNSALFHETDAIHFQDTYEGRRVNMTYLFGEQLGI